MKSTSIKTRSIRSPKGVEMIYANELYCTYCPMVFSSVCGRKRHELYHEGKRSHFCENCHVSYYRRHHLKSHKNSCRVIDSLGKDIKWCSFCDTFFRTDDGLQKHRIKFHGRRVYSCELCPCVFPSTFLLGGHKYTVHKIKANVEVVLSNGYDEVGSVIGCSKVNTSKDDQTEKLRKARGTEFEIGWENELFFGFS